MNRIERVKPTAGTNEEKSNANSRQKKNTANSRQGKAYPTAGDVKSTPNSRRSQERTQQQEKSKSIANRSAEENRKSSDAVKDFQKETNNNNVMSAISAVVDAASLSIRDKQRQTALMQNWQGHSKRHDHKRGSDVCPTQKLTVKSKAAKYRDVNEESKANIEGAPPMYDAQHPHRGKAQKRLFTNARLCCRTSPRIQARELRGKEDLEWNADLIETRTPWVARRAHDDERDARNTRKRTWACHAAESTTHSQA